MEHQKASLSEKERFAWSQIPPGFVHHKTDKHEKLSLRFVFLGQNLSIHHIRSFVSR